MNLEAAGSTTTSHLAIYTGHKGRRTFHENTSSEREREQPFKYLLNTYIAQSSTPAWFASTCSKLAIASKKDADMSNI